MKVSPPSLLFHDGRFHSLIAVLCCLTYSVSAYLNVGDILWEDDFDAGYVDTNYWSFDLGNGCPEVCGWGNQDLQYYTDEPDNVKVENGSLHIMARRQENDEDKNDNGIRFTSARVKTQDKVLVKYGTVEARIQVPDLVEGLWPAFWTLGSDISGVGWPASGEIDVLEMGSGLALKALMGNQRITSGAHWSKADGSLAAYSLHSDYPPGALNGTFFTFRLDWKPESISTTIIHDDANVDEFPIWKMDIDPIRCPDCTEFHQEHFLIFNLAVGGLYTSYTAGNDIKYSSSSSSSFRASLGCNSSKSSSAYSKIVGNSTRTTSGNDNCNDLSPRTDITAPLPATMKVDWIRVIQNGHSEVRILTPPPTTDAPSPTTVVSSPTITTFPTSSPLKSYFEVSYPTRNTVPTPVGTNAPSTLTHSRTLGPSVTTKNNSNHETTMVPSTSTLKPTESFVVDVPDGSKGDDHDDGIGKGKGKGGEKHSKNSKKQSKNSCEGRGKQKLSKNSKRRRTSVNPISNEEEEEVVHDDDDCKEDDGYDAQVQSSSSELSHSSATPSVSFRGERLIGTTVAVMLGPIVMGCFVPGL